MPRDALLADCRSLVDGEVSVAPEELRLVSFDFGGAVERSPRIIVRPTDTRDVSRIVGFAATRGLRIGTRASGHSQGGQSLSQDGILLDMTHMRRVESIDVSERLVMVQAGASWADLVAAVSQHGFLPPVLNDTGRLSLGGTHSVGGVGPASFRRGTQAGNCVGAEVVTADGTVVRCSEEKESQLFDHVMCGLGQFGVITRIEHRLRPFHPSTRVCSLLYSELETFLRDARSLVIEARVGYLDARASGTPQGPSREGADRWWYLLDLAVEGDDPAMDSVLSALSPDDVLETFDLATHRFPVRMHGEIHRVGEKGLARPWIELYMPWSSVQKFAELTLPELHPKGVLFWPLHRARARSKMFVTPEEDLLMQVGIYHEMPREDLESARVFLQGISDRGIELGGKRYLAGWLDFDLPRWREHFGDRWSGICRAKRAWDPEGVFSTGFIPFENGG